MLLRRFWRSARGFWTGDGSRFTWIVTVSLTFVVFVSLGITHGINLWKLPGITIISVGHRPTLEKVHTRR